MEIKSAAEVLFLLFLFDWACIGYCSMELALKDWPPAAAILAAGLAGFGGALVLVRFQSGFWTLDTKTQGWKQYLPAVGLRSVVVLIMAMITAMPFESIVFSSPITRRLGEERARVEVLRVLSAYQQTQATVAGRGQDLEYEDRRRDEAAKKADKAHDLLAVEQQTLDRLKASEANLNRSLLNQRQSLKQVQESVGAAAVQHRTVLAKLGANHPETVALAQRLQGLRAQTVDIEQLINASQSSLQDMLRKIDAEDLKINRMSASSKAADDARANAERSFDDRRHTLQERRDRLRDYMSRVFFAAPGETITDTQLNLAFKPTTERYDLLDRLRVLNDLRQDKAPRWPEGASADALQQLVTEFHLQLVSSAGDDSYRVLIRLGVWLVMLAGLAAPLMGFAFRLIRSEETNYYYSIAYQARAGYPAARAFAAIKFWMDEAARNSQNGDNDDKRHM